LGANASPRGLSRPLAITSKAGAAAALIGVATELVTKNKAAATIEIDWRNVRLYIETSIVPKLFTWIEMMGNAFAIYVAKFIRTSPRSSPIHDCKHESIASSLMQNANKGTDSSGIDVEKVQ
jgi:hypothetical protein